jgi:hypothetical protein
MEGRRKGKVEEEGVGSKGEEEEEEENEKGRK